MLLLEKNKTNLLTLTLTEKQTDPNCYFLFEFVNDETKDNKYLIANDISTSVHSYNQFEVIDNVNIDPYNAIQNFDYGYGRYTVYQMPTMSPLSLSPTYSTAILEQGKYYIVPSENNIVIADDNEQNIIL